MEGVEAGLEAPDPVRENIYEFDEQTIEEYGIETLPQNLGSAITALEADEVVLNGLGDHIAEKFVEAKKEEFSEYLVSVSEWEVDRYLETF